MKLKYIVIFGIVIVIVILGIMFVPYIIREYNQEIYHRSNIAKSLNLYVEDKNVGVATFYNCIFQYSSKPKNSLYPFNFPQYDQIIQKRLNEKEITIKKGQEMIVSLDNMSKAFIDINYGFYYQTKDENNSYVDYTDTSVVRLDMSIPTEKLEVGKTYSTVFRLSCGYGFIDYILHFKVI